MNHFFVTAKPNHNHITYTFRVNTEMVLLVHKKSEDDQFMTEFTADTSNDDITRTIVRLSNDRHRLSRLADELEKMIVHNSKKMEGDDHSKEDVDNYADLNLNEQQLIILSRAVDDIRLFLSKVTLVLSYII